MGRSEKSSNGGDVCLIADDDEFFRMALMTILTRTVGFTKVIETSSLDEAVECLAEARNVSLVLLDLSMPGMESAASLGAVRECFPAVRVVVVSASTRRSDMLLALEAGAHGYIPKSLGIAELASAIATVRSGAIYVPASIADLSGAEERGEGLRPRSIDPPPDKHGASLPPRPREAHLTPRQREVLELLAKGMSNRQIARTLGLSGGTVKVHVAAVFRELGVTSRAAAAVAAARVLLSDQS